MLKDEQEVMKTRAGAISGRNGETAPSGEMLVVVEFLLGKEKYAIDSAFVSEVLPFRKPTPVPLAPPFVAGLVNIRGRIISVINLMTFLNPGETGAPVQNKILVLRHRNMEFGILADEIFGTKQLDMNSLGTPPVTVNRSATGYVRGMAPEGVILLNAASILTDDKIIVNQK